MSGHNLNRKEKDPSNEAEQKLETKRQPTLDLMKFYGILLVVWGHVAMTYTKTSLIVPAVPSGTMTAIKELIYAFHMPMFVFVSGCVFSYQLEIRKKKYTIRSLFLNKAKRLMVPFYAFGFLWVCPTMVLLGFRDPLHYAVDGFVLAIDPRHLWYVIMLFEAFLLFFVLRETCKRMKIPSWLILFFAVGVYISPRCSHFLQIDSLQEYFLYFTLGYFFMLHKSLAKYVWAASAITALLSLLTHTAGVPARISTAILGTGLFLYLSAKTWRLTGTWLYRYIAPNSFGIYLFHAMIIYLMEYALRTVPLNPFALSLLVFTVSVVLSVELTKCVRRYLSPAVIGEK